MSAAYTLNDWARILHESGDIEAAEAKCLQFLRFAENVKWGVIKNEFLAATQFILARIRLDRDDAKGAETFVRKGIDYHRKRFPEDNYQLALGKSLLGESLTRQGRFEEAESPLMESAPIIEKTYGPQDRRTVKAHQRIRELFAVWGKPGPTSGQNP